MHALYDKFPTAQPPVLEIYQMARAAPPWDSEPMAARPDKKAIAESSARAIAARLKKMGMPKQFESERQWINQAGVSSSFFSNLRGNQDKPPSDPSVGNLRLILEAAGTSMPEFFLDEAQGRVALVPSKRDVERAIRDALDDLPARRDRRVEYLASTFSRLLGLPKSRSATPAAGPRPAKGARAEGAPPRRATKKA